MTLDEAKKILGDLNLADHGVYFEKFGYAFWRPGEAEASLDAEFTADDLEAIATFMREYKT